MEKAGLFCATFFFNSFGSGTGDDIEEKSISYLFMENSSTLANGIDRALSKFNKDNKEYFNRIEVSPIMNTELV